MIRLLQPSFWFDAYPLPFNQPAFWVFTGVFLAGIALGFILYYLQAKKLGDKLLLKAFRKFTNFGFSFGMVGLILVFFKHQRVPYLGMRIWLTLWLLACLGWLIFILKYALLDLPKLKKEKERQKEFEKYLP